MAIADQIVEAWDVAKRKKVNPVLVPDQIINEMVGIEVSLVLVSPLLEKVVLTMARANCREKIE